MGEIFCARATDGEHAFQIKHFSASCDASTLGLSFLVHPLQGVLAQLLSSLWCGRSGCILEAFSSHPCMVGFKGCKPQWQRWTLPVNLHGDAVPTVGCGKIWSKMLQAYSWTCLLSKGSTKQRSFFIWGATWLKDSKLLVALQLVLKHVEEILWV